MAKWNSKLKLLHLVNLLLSDVVFARGPLPPGPQSNLRPITSSQSSLSESQTQLLLGGSDVHPAHQLVLNLSTSLKGQLHLHSNASCVELSTGGWRGNGFSQELLGLAMVPVLVSAGCMFEAQELVMKLYAVLGQEDTHELLQDVLILIKRGKEKESTNAAHHTYRNTSLGTSSPTILSQESQHHLQGLIFNINQLAELGKSIDSYEGEDGRRGQCKGWVRVKGTQLLGVAAEQIEPLRLDGAQKACRRLGLRCAGVTQDSSPEYYRVMLRHGSRVVPSSSSESWIQNCDMAPVRWRRNTVQNNCMNKKEKQVYTVVEWIPAVSTLYNLGTAIYYASLNCYDTAKERAILSTVDLGTDALMAVTGGTAGVAGYALGAGLKTGVKAGVKYLLNSMKEEDDLLMNQNSWEDGTLNVQ